MSLFLQKCASNVQVDSRELDRRKTLQVSLPVKPANDNDEFEKQRTAAIAEVAKSKEVRASHSFLPSAGVILCSYSRSLWPLSGLVPGPPHLALLTHFGSRMPSSGDLRLPLGFVCPFPSLGNSSKYSYWQVIHPCAPFLSL